MDLKNIKRLVAYNLKKIGFYASQEDAEDATSYVLEQKLIASHRRIRWLVIDWVRTKSGRKGIRNERPLYLSIESATAMDYCDAIYSTEPDHLERLYHYHDRRSQFEKNLSPRDKSILRMRVDEGYPLKEIGKYLGVSEATVCVRMKELIPVLERILWTN